MFYSSYSNNYSTQKVSYSRHQSYRCMGGSSTSLPASFSPYFPTGDTSYSAHCSPEVTSYASYSTNCFTQKLPYYPPLSRGEHALHATQDVFSHSALPGILPTPHLARREPLSAKTGLDLRTASLAHTSLPRCFLLAVAAPAPERASSCTRRFRGGGRGKGGLPTSHTAPPNSLPIPQASAGMLPIEILCAPYTGYFLHHSVLGGDFIHCSTRDTSY